eukprot:CAMPEP_0173459374 /NCGR_PEP_ID=MMETSP1357-20121228/61271_1 /TAXON_ID=77926 /ORGANISM="Hemiselmis rufescens, Strain PCC563" /LENGTH=127 /DNA_ID=CAMNT_0014426831 /DNA_START=138 /DNA_END=518 /DNA_ORIENTATION=-
MNRNTFDTNVGYAGDGGGDHVWGAFGLAGQELARLDQVVYRPVPAVPEGIEVGRLNRAVDRRVEADASVDKPLDAASLVHVRLLVLSLAPKLEVDPPAPGAGWVPLVLYAHERLGSIQQVRGRSVVL